MVRRLQPCDGILVGDAIRVSSMNNLHEMIAGVERNVKAAQSSDEKQP